ncbi:MAG: hypothetical protein BTN85_1149 [Candidatus Methanohalarchaeum thermophilum]|uniref:Uncharacterized protein n=1 Tax=Methanohalarchaeum thermophilum TaxID=1903181 RepID=A0A1Q6DWG7_METT1|nr:MAG: hypothetical protein BTN85_1149 [Candidatus Methanohalarchaeum thermophilum]
MKIELKIDEEKIPLNRFVSSVLKNILIGVIKELHGIEENWKNIEINIKKEEK